MLLGSLYRYSNKSICLLHYKSRGRPINHHLMGLCTTVPPLTWPVLLCLKPMDFAAVWQLKALTDKKTAPSLLRSDKRLLPHRQADTLSP